MYCDYHTFDRPGQCDNPTEPVIGLKDAKPVNYTCDRCLRYYSPEKIAGMRDAADRAIDDWELEQEAKAKDELN